jgi:hypothetical protein
MSRAERRAYQRMNKNRDPYAMPVAPAQKARIERVRARREQRRGEAFVFASRRFLLLGLGGALLTFLIGFSVAWPSGMPFALYVGLAAGAFWGALTLTVRLAQRRAAATRP